MTISVRVRVGVLGAVLMAVLAAAAPPAGAANANLQANGAGLEVGGSHSDFGTGDEPDPAVLENFSLRGSGDSASISGPVGGQTKGGGLVADGDSISWSESSPSTSDSVLNVTGVVSTTTETINQTGLTDAESVPVTISGNMAPTGPASGDPAVTLTALSRTYSKFGSHSEQGDTVTRTVHVDSPEAVTASIRGQTVDGGNIELLVNGNSKGDQGTGIDGDDAAVWTVTLQPGDNTLTWTNAGGTPDYGSWSWDHTVAPENASVTFDTGETVSMDGGLSDGQTKTVGVDLSTSTSAFDVSLGQGKLNVGIEYTERTQTTDAGVVFNSDSSQEITVSGHLSSGETVIKEIDNSWLESSNTATVTLNDSGLSADAPPMRAKVSIEEPAATATYIGANYTAASHGFDRSSVAAINWSGTGPLDVTIQGWTGSQWEDARQLSTSTTGNVTLEYAPIEYQKTRTKIVAQGNAVIYDESILFTNHAPQASNFSPATGTDLSETAVDFSLNVSDPEFGTAQGDDVTAELYIDGSSAASTTVTSNQTVTLTESITEGGDHTYHWELTDSYGATTTTSQRTITVPAELTVRDVLTQNIVDAQNATITFYGGQNEREIIEKPVSNGTVSLAGLPTNTGFTVVVRADDYYTRTAIIPSLYDQSQVWLLPTNGTDAVEVVFQLEDRTGDFSGSDTTQLRVQRAIEFNNSTAWYDVVGDDISATSELPTILQNQQRYRLVIENDVQTRILGSYTPSGPADPETIPIGRLDFNADTDPGTSFDAALVNDTAPAVRIMYRDPDTAMTALRYRVVNTTNGSSTVVVANTTVSDPSAFTSITEPLPAASLAGRSYRVDLWALQDGVVVEERSASVGELQAPGVGWAAGASTHLLTLGGYVFLVAVGYGTANYSPRLGTLAAVVIGTALTMFGVLSIPHVILGFTGTVAVIQNAADTT